MKVRKRVTSRWRRLSGVHQCSPEGREAAEEDASSATDEGTHHEAQLDAIKATGLPSSSDWSRDRHEGSSSSRRTGDEGRRPRETQVGKRGGGASPRFAFARRRLPRILRENRSLDPTSGRQQSGTSHRLPHAFLYLNMAETEYIPSSRHEHLNGVQGTGWQASLHPGRSSG